MPRARLIWLAGITSSASASATPRRDTATIRDPGQTATLEVFIETDIKFHQCVAKASHNRLMRLIVDALEEIIRESIINLQTKRKSADPLRKYRLHQRLLKTIEDRDPVAAVATMNEHFDASSAVVAELLNERGSSSQKSR
jgi:DNA-binding FadR family transcriptional regulator